MSREAFTSALASSVCPSEKLFPRKRVLPREAPRSTMAEKMAAREITVDEIPITSGVVNLDRKSQRMYPTDIPIIVST